MSKQKEEYFSTTIISMWWKASRWTAKNMMATYREWEGLHILFQYVNISILFVPFPA
jgi:hypothetical protein